MADKSKIEWTEATWTPIRARAATLQRDGSWKARIGWHCTHASPGCSNCYAESINLRLGTGLKFLPANLYDPARHRLTEGKAELFLDDRTLLAPLRWKRGRMIFVCSMTDLFADFVPDDWIDRIFAVMALCPQHTFQVLTKRSKRMREYFEGEHPLIRLHHRAAGDVDGEIARPFRPYGNIYSLYCSVPWPLPNFWLGVSTEDQARADERIPDLLATPAAVRFISAEPLLGPIDLTLNGLACEPCMRCANGEHLEPDTNANGCPHCEGSGKIGDLALDWVIAGGESGPGARAMHPGWARSLRDQCAAAGVPFFFKQWGEWAPSTPEQAAGNPRSGWCALRGHPRVAKAEELTAEAGAVFIEHLGKRAAGRLLDGREHNDLPN